MDFQHPGISAENLLMTPIAFPVLHPARRLLLRRGSRIHLAAAALITANAVAYTRMPGASPVYFWCQLIVAADILLLVLADGETLRESPSFGLFFRLAECLLFLMAGVLLLRNGQLAMGISQLAVTIFYNWVFYREWRANRMLRITVQHIGITIPGDPLDIFLPWGQVRSIACTNGEWQIQSLSGRSWSIEIGEEPEEELLSALEAYQDHYLR